MQRLEVARSITLPSLPVHAWLMQMGFPRSYTGKFLLVALLGSILPPAIILIYIALHPAWLSSAATFFVVPAAVLLGAGLTGTALLGLLCPFHKAQNTLNAFLNQGIVPKEELSASPHDEGGQLVRNLNYALVMFDAHRKQVQRDSQRDLLTGLLNRRTADERLWHIISTIPNQPFDLCLALIDIDNFRGINDRYGHQMGDEVLKRVAKAVTQRLRGTDWVARWGNDELLLAIQSDCEGAGHALERVRQDIEQMVMEHGDNAVQITLSIGYAAVPTEGRIEQMVARAETALYNAKQQGRNRVVMEA